MGQFDGTCIFPIHQLSFTNIFLFIAEPKDVGLKINETDIQTTFESEIEIKDDDTF